jgi:hypothetical protein
MKKVLLLVALLALTGLVFAQDFVGPEKCLQCHNNPGLGDQTGWRSSMHANGYSVVMDDAFTMQDLYGVINDYDENGADDFHDGLDFNTINSKFDIFKPNAPVLAYDAENGYSMKIGEVTHKVLMTYGGSGLYKQRYIMKINTAEGASAGHYVSPIQYNEKTREYVLYHADDWYDESNLPIYTAASTKADASANSRNLVKQCSGCHSPLVSVSQDANGEWIGSGAPVLDEAAYAGMSNIVDFDGDGNLDQINTGCENCHGAGGDHVIAPSKANIINPGDAEDMTTEQANNLCGMCHSRGKSLPQGIVSYPFDETNMQPWFVKNLADGEYLVADLYSDGGGYWGDGVHSVKHHQQFYDLYKSSKPEYEYHHVTCYECHDVHNTVKHHIRESVVETDAAGGEILVATENDNNTLCLSCHATHGAFEGISVEMVADYASNVDAIGAIVSEHTRHDYDPEGNGESRCSKCHNPKSAKSAVAYDIHSHTFEVIAPQKTKMYAMPNACAVSCHMQEGLSFDIDMSGDNLATWDEASDLALADKLMEYYGPEGEWWQHGDITSVDRIAAKLPDTHSLLQNYPNPFNPTTTIPFEVQADGFATLEIFNVQGQLISTLLNEELPAGSHQVRLNAFGLVSGVYFYKLTIDDFTQTNKMMLVK